MAKLDETRNFLSLFLHVCGQSEMPRDFFFWSGMSLLAACVADRVWLEPDRARKFTPNLYIMLLGVSGCGKEYAINKAMEFAVRQPTINLYGGVATAQYLLKYMAKRTKGPSGWEFANTKLYLVTEETGMTVRPGEQAHDFVTTLTGLYKGRPYPFKKGTITGEEYEIPDPCINWLAGSTDAWLVRSVGRDAVEGGFFARLVCVRGMRDHAVRYPRIEVPEDIDEVVQHLHQRVEGYVQAGGSMTVTPEAMAIHDEWYNTREAPYEQHDEPGFNRSDEMVYRFATLLALADWDVTEQDYPSGLVEAAHMHDAIELWNQVREEAPAIMRKASSTPRTSAVEVIGEIIRRAGDEGIKRGQLSKRAAGYGIDADGVDRAVRALLRQEEIEADKPKEREDGKGLARSGPIPTTYYWKHFTYESDAAAPQDPL